MAWDPPTDLDLVSGAVALSSHVKAIRDLSEALAGRLTGSPWLNGVGEQVIFIASDTWVVPAGVTQVRAILIGAGGAGGAGQDTHPTLNSPGAGGGGGAGCLAIHSGLVTTPAETLTITVGTDGIGGSGAGGTGGASSVSTVVGGWSSVSAPGGVGGAAGVDAFAAGGAGGSPPTADDIPGATGSTAIIGLSGAGAASAFGSGAPGVVMVTVPLDGVHATTLGAGGSGGYARAAGLQTKDGGNGESGIVILEY